jgi:hypothetical protein
MRSHSWEMVEQRGPKRDPISIVATYGAVILVGANLVYRIANRQWGSVAFMAAMAAVVLWVYIRAVPLDNLNDDETQSGSS